MKYKQSELYEIKFFKKTNRKEFTSEQHPLYGGMMENSRVSLKCPVEANGKRKKVLDDDEIEELAKDLKIPAETLSHYNGSFWSDYRLELTKDGKRLDLDNPIEYIDYKVAINWFPVIAPNFERAKDHPHIKFYVEDANANSNRSRNKAKQRKEIYDLYDQHKDEKYTLKYMLEQLGSITSSHTPIDILQDMMLEQLEGGNLSRVFAVLTEDHLRIKATLLEATEKGVLSKGNDRKLKARNAEIGALSYKGEETTVPNVARFFADAKNNEAYNIIRALNKKEN